MAQMNAIKKRNFTNSMRNDGKTAKMRNNSAKSGMVGMSVCICHKAAQFGYSHTTEKVMAVYGRGVADRPCN